LSKCSVEEVEMKQKRDKIYQPEDKMHAYEILLKRHLNDDRLLSERSYLFLASSSILFIGFVMLPPSACILRIFLPVLGIMLSLLALVGNRRTSKGLYFWEEGEKKIEKEEQKFTYMRNKEIAPHTVYDAVNTGWLGRKLRWIRNRHIYAYWLPCLFFILWIISLVSVRVN